MKGAEIRRRPVFVEYTKSETRLFPKRFRVVARPKTRRYNPTAVKRHLLPGKREKHGAFTRVSKRGARPLLTERRLKRALENRADVFSDRMFRKRVEQFEKRIWNVRDDQRFLSRSNET